MNVINQRFLGILAGDPAGSLLFSVAAFAQDRMLDALFVPDQPYNDDIEYGKNDRSNSMRVCKTIDLVNDEKSHDHERSRISPKLVSEQVHYKQ